MAFKLRNQEAFSDTGERRVVRLRNLEIIIVYLLQKLFIDLFNSCLYVFCRLWVLFLSFSCLLSTDIAYYLSLSYKCCSVDVNNVNFVSYVPYV